MDLIEFGDTRAQAQAQGLLQASTTVLHSINLFQIWAQKSFQNMANELF